VAAELQGRVFATQQMMARSAAPLAYLLAGPLAERVFEPMLRPGGALAGSAGQILGSGPGRGIGLLFILMGAIKLLITLAGFLNPAVRFIEEN
jgi:DHA3 family macrolide efflux protein-like MFS transporter